MRPLLLHALGCVADVLVAAKVRLRLYWRVHGWRGRLVVWSVMIKQRLVFRGKRVLNWNSRRLGMGQTLLLVRLSQRRRRRSLPGSGVGEHQKRGGIFQELFLLLVLAHDQRREAGPEKKWTGKEKKRTKKETCKS